MALRTPLTAQPHLYIGDSTGRPLDYGRVYFGEPNKDPEFYPIDIYLDPEMTIAAAQPVRTKGGFMDVGGNLAELHAAEVIYSLKVLDQYGRQVFYKPEMYRNNVSDFLVDEITRATAAETLIAGNLTAETQRAIAAEKVIADAVVTEKDRAVAAEVALDAKHAALSSTINSLGGGKKAYTTYALMVADKNNIAANSSIDVTNDTDPLKNGTYSYDGAVFTKSIYDVESIVRTKVLNTFKTKSLMDASALPDGADAQVTNDPANNGLYVKTAGTWVKSAYDPLGQAKTYTDAKITALPSALDTNKKVFNLDARTKFVASEIEGVFSSYDFTPVALASYDVNTTKDFIFSLGSALTTWSSMWRMGHERNNVRNFELNTTFTVTSEITRTSAIAVFIGDTAPPYGFMWFSNGSIALITGNANNAVLSSGVKASLVYETAQELSLQVVIRKDNTGYVVAKNITTSASYRLEFDLNALSVTMQGSVYLGVYRHSNVKFTYYNVQYPDAISGDEASNDDVAALSSRVGSIELELQSSGASEPKVLIAPPKGFLFTDYGFNIYRGLQSHKVTTDFDIKSKKFAATKSIYVNNNIGLDTNAGTEASPYKSFAKAITEANASGSVCNIFVKSGHYNYLDVGVLPILTVDTNIICSDSAPAVMSLTSTETGWVKDSTYTNLYKKTVEGAAPIWAFDNGNLDEYGEGRGLLTQTTLALADTATGSIFIDGQTVYVRLLDDRAPDTKVHVIRDLAGLNAGATSIYIENIHVLGGYTTAFYLGNPDTDKHCYFLNCRFSYGGDRSFRVIKRNGYVYSVNCIASWAKGSDGFTYTTGGLDTTNIVEINCKGHHNGLHGGKTHNGSTVHQGGKIIRIGGDYSYNFNKNVADTGTGTQAWCIKCIASHAQDPSYGGSSNVGYVFAGGEVEGWLDDCLAYGSEESYNVGEGSKMHLRNTIYNELTPKNIVGTVDAY